MKRSVRFTISTARRDWRCVSFIEINLANHFLFTIIAQLLGLLTRLNESQSGGGPQSANDIFSMFFGGGRRAKQSGPRKGEDVVHQITVDLADFYNGKVKKLAINRKVPVNPEEKPKPCDLCDARGVRMMTRQIGPGMIQQMQVACDSCGGLGYQVKMKQERQILECNIEKGMKHGQKVVLRGEADQLPGTVPGDVIFVLAMEPHARFQRNNDDLLTTKSITLVEALCGCQFLLEHLDGRKLLCKTKPGEVIKPGHIKAIDDEGMPMHKNPFVKGKLYIKFDIVFPPDGSINPQAISVLERCLPRAEAPQIPMDAEEVTMRNADLAHMGANAGGRGSSHLDEDGDEDMGGGGRGVQCAQQ
mmetsp:Transcript_71250/g.190229  ORF Transcript_71250/g.190229 Transcript_71250/m.190229 type:complete len:360 (-) Transcript_71250:6-1085(-)